MTVLGRETANIQNPALGSIILWRFAVGYTEDSATREAAPLPLLFLVLPVVLHSETAELIASTQKRSGLRAFVGKFGESRVSKSDLVLSIHNRALQMKGLSLESLRLALSNQRLVLDTKGGSVQPASRTQSASGIPESVKPLLKAAEKFGHWCAPLSLHEIAISLKVSF